MKRIGIILAGTLLLLAVVAYILLHGSGAVKNSGSTGDLLATYDSALVDKLILVSRGTPVTLTKEREGWMITSPFRHRADPALVDSAIARGKRIELKGLVSADPAKLSVYEIDSTGTLVRVFAGGIEKGAFWIGKAGLLFTEAYVRRDGSNEIYEADGPLAWFFARTPAEWRDRTIVRIQRDAITRISYRYGDTTFTLQIRDGVWTVDGRPASRSAAAGVVSSLSNYLANDFVDTVALTPKRPAAVVEAGGTQLSFYRVEGSGRYLVQNTRERVWYSVEGWRANEVLKRKKDLLAP